jgi:hypothetical protein
MIIERQFLQIYICLAFVSIQYDFCKIVYIRTKS